MCSFVDNQKSFVSVVPDPVVLQERSLHSAGDSLSISVERVLWKACGLASTS